MPLYLGRRRRRRVGDVGVERERRSIEDADAEVVDGGGDAGSLAELVVERQVSPMRPAGYLVFAHCPPPWGVDAESQNVPTVLEREV